ncbi:M14 family zinc carboxypeptidase [Candidatus Eisenbacteria bacterium]|uniref:M14 family zinc carboxypeptidase n=1 Tax=Eiseniibacteriota bacterium TaxID=2212470 RepID=A0ABV6YM21_UNCEI
MRLVPIVRLIALGALLLTVCGATLVLSRTGPDERYYEYEEVLTLFDTYAATYPDIFHREIIGYSGVENEPIWAAKISDNASVHEPEARLFIHAAQHANECNGTGAVMYMIDRLLTRYGVQSYYTDMVDNLEMWFVPVVNIDGHRKVFEGEPNWDWWRKTKRDNDENGEYTFPEDGVDTNRNWNFKWARYDSTNYWSSRYKGPYPFSEACVVAIRDLILRERPVFVMDLHSPDVVSIANRIWYPWYDPDLGQSGPDTDHFRPISIALGNRCETEVDGNYVDGDRLAYNSLPKEQCWVYSNTGICAFLMEVSLQFWWTGSIVDTIAARTGRGNFYLMERALSGPGLTGTVTRAGTDMPLQAEIVVTQAHDSSIGPRMTEQFHGQYWRLLNAGNYQVTASARDYDPDTQTIYVSASGWTQLDFQLEPDPAAVDDEELLKSRLLWADTPLRPGGAVHFRLDRAADVSLDLLDVTGRQVMSVFRGQLQPGARTVTLDQRVPTGSYLLRLRTEDVQVSSKVVVVD